ncbi:cytochrome d ubiquinol oxidase subunit II [Mumia sp. zg.B53]|uniref:cytochrome d ubiquinol oxidase subunit II n=1 Tax=unclassified Mumia TaxID=2621872 RepID=UPI001C6E9D88|nr:MULTISPECIES: cytochrome d ubiquinol oxidase subunit II [unclassified Mumia]MBW9205595.1 cytochrome d ubiquinol oxidase subunit II [Mumia sp. zg.B17]MBW9216361.1 cytochrome d ubiquinol oxidase subunit II [Mumia sp. zg.B53]MDD9348590.1 cytochrome d ubiquinol oxidase subunit II [Mumia sp.]
MELTTIWFCVIAFLFIGYFVLEGFDFGVGMLLPILGRNDRERRTMINTIGPLWDGNEVWLIVAGASIFAAFPEWYATLFSGFYLPLLLILVALIVRGVAFEYRHQRDDATWKSRWDAAIIFGSFVPALLWGVAFGNIVRGVEIDADKNYVGGFFDLLNPYALLAGVVMLTLFLTHGANFLALKTSGIIHERARAFSLKIGLVAAVLAVAFLLWTCLDHDKVWVWALSGLAALTFVGGLLAAWARRDGWAFMGTMAAIGLAVMSLFVALFPDVMPSTLDPAYSLTTENAASTDKTLTIMSWVAVVFVPIVIGYQAWSYWVFRKRISVDSIAVEDDEHLHSPV